MTERFLIIVPSINHNNIFNFQYSLFTSLTHPADVMILDGNEGLVQTYNWSIKNVLDESRHQWFAKIDDDVKLSYGWQDDLLQAFEDIPNLGAAGLDYSSTQEGYNYMGPLRDWRRLGKTEYNDPVGNVAGGCILMRSALVNQIGETPLVPDTKYQFYEDGWRCGRTRQLGHSIAYVRVKNPVSIIHYDSPTDYLNKKREDTERCKAMKEIWWL